ncbi:MOSC domain-containing protein [Exophiala viscosa]|uniref:MOSC domain-containing protein n=1 Tax=Exophiala viscosa TaxID=2486360 RepID=UPI00219404FD|nr:MOSC domain-containing protein [Exophiala viscosa]
MDRLAVLLPPILLAVTLICIQEAWRMRHSLRGYKQVTLQGRSHMSDEYNLGYTKPRNTRDESKWKVKALHIHPIKSCAAVELDVADIDGAGLTWDRKFAFAELLKPQTRLDASEVEKKPRWTFRTQRQPGYEKLVHVHPEIWLPDRSKQKFTEKDKGFLVVKYPRIPRGPLATLVRMLTDLGFLSNEKSFTVPLVPPENHKYPSEHVAIWKDNPRWLNFGVHVPADFGTYLGVKNPLTLFRVDPKSYREVYRCAPRKESLGYQSVVGFADAYPVHLLNIASVRDVAGKVAKDIPRFSAKRFRANILVSGPSAYDEDNWKRIRIGKHTFYCACHTVRCRLPNVDPDTADRHPVEPDKTLKAFRCIDDGDPLNACLGLQLVPAESEPFQIRVDDEIEVLERGEHHYIKQ